MRLFDAADSWRHPMWPIRRQNVMRACLPLLGATFLGLGSWLPAIAQHPSIDDDRSGSAFVPMDSWVYPALERLSTLGLIPSQSVSIRPWTRQECRRQLREAEDILFGF